VISPAALMLVVDQPEIETPKLFTKDNALPLTTFMKEPFGFPGPLYQPANDEP